MAGIPASLSAAEREEWERTSRALDGLGAPQTEARFYAMFEECQGADDGPLELPGLTPTAPTVGPFASQTGPAGSRGTEAGGMGMFALLAAQGNNAGLAPGPAAGVAPRAEPIASDKAGTAAAAAPAEDLDDDGLETIELPDDGPSPSGGGNATGGSLEERVLRGDVSGGSVLFDNFTEGMDGGGVADEGIDDVRAHSDSTDDDSAAAVALMPPRASLATGGRPRGALLQDAPKAAASEPSPVDATPPAASAVVDAGETVPVEDFAVDPDFDYDIPASKLTSRLGGLGMSGPWGGNPSADSHREGPVNSADEELEAAHAEAVTAALRHVRPDLAAQLVGNAPA